MRRLKAFIFKEFIQIRRDRMTLAMMLLLPIIQLIIFGYAINTDVKHLDTVVFDQSRTAESRRLVEEFTVTQYFDVTKFTGGFDEVEAAIQSGRAKVGIVIPPDFASILERGKGAPVQVLVDASDSMSSSSAISTAQLLGLKKKMESLMKSAGSQNDAGWYDLHLRAWYNRDFRSPWFMVPGILGLILTMTMMMITSMAIVREREQGTLEQLLVTPMRTWELLAGKIIPYTMVGYVQLTIGILIGSLVFNVPFRGNPALLYLLTFLFITATLAFGILISTVAKTQMQAVIMSIFGLMPSILLSGLVFPREGMPLVFYYASMILPLTWFLEIIRGIMLKGVSANLLLTQIGALTGLLVLFLTVSIFKFKKTMD
jgi:ABC-2 type transport system permease protein